jgi:acyl-CoA synthetase (AMP-forming)/AMP-acid ligase II
MGRFASVADRDAIEQAMRWEDRNLPVTMYQFLTRTRDAHPKRPALSFQILSGPKDKAETLSWSDLHAQVTQCANLFRSLGVGETDVVAYLLPNCTETAVTLLSGMVAGIVNPINPLLEPEQIAAILRETKAKVLVTLKPFPRPMWRKRPPPPWRWLRMSKRCSRLTCNRYLTRRKAGSCR